MKMMAQLHVVKKHAANREWVTVGDAQCASMKGGDDR